jgi:uncharacterized protein (TIGR02598 family)
MAGFGRRVWRRAGRLRAFGFSLVEVAIALGVVAFSLTTVLALLPSVLKSMRESIDQTLESQIGQQIASDVLQTPFRDVGAMTKYYDSEGFPVAAAGEAVFTARITPSTVSYPGSNQLTGLATPLSSSLKALNVTITTRSNQRLAARYHHSFTLYLARREKL